VGRPPETEYVERAKRGDHDAYESLLRMHEHVAFRTAYAIVGSAADAEEVAQDAFVKAYRALHRFRPGSPFRPWLLRIVANEARNRPEAGVIASEQRDELLAALARLGEDERLAIVARYFVGLTDDETAAALGVRRGAVKMRVWRALSRLREELGEAP
jgi:DNA-directed RNA polymerase specialized sigma24 family protein